MAKRRSSGLVSSPLFQQIEEMIEERLLEVEALEKTRDMLLVRQGVVRRDQASMVKVEKSPRFVKKPRLVKLRSPWTTKLEMIIGTSPGGMTTGEAIEALKESGVDVGRGSKNSIYGAIHQLKLSRRIRTDKMNRHHVLVSLPSTKLIEAGR